MRIWDRNSNLGLYCCAQFLFLSQAKYWWNKTEKPSNYSLDKNPWASKIMIVVPGLTSQPATWWARGRERLAIFSIEFLCLVHNWGQNLLNNAFEKGVTVLSFLTMSRESSFTRGSVETSNSVWYHILFQSLFSSLFLQNKLKTRSLIQWSYTKGR